MRQLKVTAEIDPGLQVTAQEKGRDRLRDTRDNTRNNRYRSRTRDNTRRKQRKIKSLKETAHKESRDSLRVRRDRQHAEGARYFMIQ